MPNSLSATSAGSTLLPEPTALISTIPAHFLAGLLVGRFTLEDWPRNPATDKKVAPRSDDITTGVAFALNYDYHFCFIRSSGTMYVKVPDTYIYLRCPDERLTELVTQRWTLSIAVLGASNPKKIKDTVEMVKNYAKERMDTISRRYISVSPNLYWDTETATLTDAPTQPVFFRLFDTDEETLHIRKVPEFTDHQISVLKSEFERILTYQEEHEGDLPEDFSFVQLWANFSHDLYCDIMKASANVFMRRKTMGAFMPIGLRRNGKTAWSNDFMKTMLGANNTSSVQMANLGNPHQTNQLQWTLYNAPDEEREVPTKYIEEFKGLPLDTPIPTPSGFTPMGELKVGDIVYDKDFRPTAILHKSQVHHNPCYKLTFSSHETVVADHEHRWLVEVGQAGHTQEKVWTTLEIKEALERKVIVRVLNPTCAELDSAPTPLPIDPYLLGVWLGDGSKDSGEINNPSAAIWKELQYRGACLSSNREKREGYCPRRSVEGLSHELGTLGLRGNKHLPMLYLRSSRQQRLELLRGLMDTDGHYDKTHKRAVMSTTQAWQRDAMVQLVSSLGWVPTVTTVKRSGFGKSVVAYDIKFTPTEAVFCVRNQNVKYNGKSYSSRRRQIVSVEPVATVPTQCIQVDSPSHTYLCGHNHLVTHNTICDHGHLDMDKFFSQDTIPLNCDFVCVCPMNSEPQWAAQGMAPLVARSYVMPFTHDFKAEDADPIPFPERTFTAEMFSHMLGHLFAIAAYYRNRNLYFSEVVMSYQRNLDEETSSHITYFNHFIVFFDGFQSVKQVYEDYKLWCQSNAHDCVPVSQGTFKLAFAEFMKGRERSRASVNGTQAKVYRIPRTGYKPMINEATYRGFKRYVGRPCELHNKEPALSIVERLEAEMEEVFKEEYKREMNRQIELAKKFIDGQKKISPPPEPEQQPLEDDIFN